MLVELSLDPRPFVKGQKEAGTAFKKTGEEAKKSGTVIEDSGKKAAEVLGQLRNQVLALFAAFTAGRGLKDFTEDLVDMDANIGRTAKTLDISTESLSAWQGVAEQAGGTADGVVNSFRNLQDIVNEITIMGKASPAISFFNALGISLGNVNGKAKTPDELAMDVAKSRFPQLSAAQRQFYGSNMGFDQGMINALSQGPVALQKNLDMMRDLGLTTEDSSEKAQEAYKSWTQLGLAATSVGRTIFVAFGPALTWLADKLTALAEWARAHPRIIETIFGGLAVVAILASIGIALAGIGAIIGVIAAWFAILAAPIGATIVGLLAIAGVATFWYNEWKPVLEWFESIWSGIVDKVDGAYDGVKKFLGLAPAAKSAALPKTASTSNESDIAKLQALGWTREQAAGIAANIQAESGGNPNAVGDNGSAYGLAQWHQDRQARFKKWAGHDIRSSTRDEQLAFVNYELRQGTEQRAGRALAGATTAQQAGSLVSYLYERPLNQSREASLRGALAAALLQPSTGNGGVGAAVGAQAANINSRSNSVSNSSSAETNIGTLVVHTQASDAAGIAKALPGAIERSSFAAQANQGPS